MSIRVDVQQEFTSCLRELGAIVSDDANCPAKKLNADFWFPDQLVAAELKCITEDYFENRNFQSWLNERYGDWVNRGLAAPLAKPKVINLAQLPRPCYLEVASFVRKRIESSLKQASKQLQATRQAYDQKKSTGLLILVNDGNYGIVPGMMSDIIARSLPKYSGINTVIHFTVNMRSTLPELASDVIYWCQWSIKSVRPPVPAQFLDQIRASWSATHSRAINQEIPEFTASTEELFALKYVKR